MRYFVLAVACTIGISGAGFAQTSEQIEMPDSCEMTSENGFIRIVICTASDATQETYINAGRAACGEDLPCGAWIWNDAALAPKNAPSNHDGLTQAEITSSKGVWVAENKSFITIDQAN
ncbi:MAG: hypothetical protein AAGF53_11700 [Pseudomonadota bacterium]